MNAISQKDREVFNDQQKRFDDSAHSRLQNRMQNAKQSFLKSAWEKEYAEYSRERCPQTINTYEAYRSTNQEIPKRNILGGLSPNEFVNKRIQEKMDWKQEDLRECEHKRVKSQDRSEWIHQGRLVVPSINAFSSGVSHAVIRNFELKQEDNCQIFEDSYNLNIESAHRKEKLMKLISKGQNIQAKREEINGALYHFMQSGISVDKQKLLMILATNSNNINSSNNNNSINNSNEMNAQDTEALKDEEINKQLLFSNNQAKIMNLSQSKPTNLIQTKPMSQNQSKPMSLNQSLNQDEEQFKKVQFETQERSIITKPNFNEFSFKKTNERPVRDSNNNSSSSVSLKPKKQKKERSSSKKTTTPNKLKKGKRLNTSPFTRLDKPTVASQMRSIPKQGRLASKSQNKL